MNFVLRMLWREVRTSWARLGFFFLCVGLGVASIVLVRSVTQQVRQTLTSEARSLIGADLVLQVQRAWTDDLRSRVETLLRGNGLLETTDAVETQTMAASADGSGTGQVKLVEIFGVESRFPFYGTIELQNGRTFSHDLVRDHGVVVEPELLVALGLEEGQSLRLAGQNFMVRGVIAKDRVQRDGLAFGPRVYVDLADLRQTSILGFGSRVSQLLMVRLDDAYRAEAVADRLRESLEGDLVRVRSWQNLEDRIGRNLRTAENYLSLVGFAVVILGGIGVWSVTRVIVQEKIRSVAILKCIGASAGRVLAIYVLQVVVLALGGSLVGVMLGRAAVAAIPTALLTSFGVESVSITLSAAAQGVAVGLLVSVLFAVVPLLEIRRIKPLLLLRVDTGESRRQPDWQSRSAGVLIGLALALVAVWQAGSARAGGYVFLGLAVVAGVLYAASLAVVRLTKPLARSKRFAVRHATVSLSRPGNQTRVILMAVGLGTFFVLGVRALQVNLLEELTAGIGETSPDLVLIDVQADQVEGVREVVGPYLRTPARIMPLMRGRVVEVIGRGRHLRTPAEVRQEADLGREYGVTFRPSLEPNETLLAGQFWDSPLTTPLEGVDTEVSMEEEEFEEAGLELGDLLRFDFAGGRLLARVTSVRRVEWENSQNGGFVFVFRPAPAVSRLPHSYVGFLQTLDDPVARGAIQRELVAAHPNVSAIDVRAVLASVRDIIDDVTLGITVVGSIVLAGGVLILVGAVAMTRYQRLYDTAIYRTLGAGSRLVTATAAVEYGLVGVLAGLIGASGALALSWVLARFLFEMDWRPAWSIALVGVVLTGALVCFVGLAASAGVLRRKPLLVLRGE